MPTSSIAAFPTDDQLKSIRVLLELLVIVANVTVWWGVYLERDEFPRETQEKGWWLLIKGLAAELAFGALLFVADTTLGVRQEGELIAARQAEYLLRQKVIWRELTDDQCSKIVGAIGASSGTLQIWYPLGDVEAQQLSIEYEKCFGEKAKWQVGAESIVFWDLLPHGIAVKDRASVAHDLAIRGLDAAHVEYHPLNNEMLKGHVGWGSGSKYTSPGEPDLTILIGSRPVH